MPKNKIKSKVKKTVSKKPITKKKKPFKNKVLKIIEERKITEVHLNLEVNPKIFSQIIEVLKAKGVKVNFLKILKPKNKRDISFFFISIIYIFYAFVKN